MHKSLGFPKGDRTRLRGSRPAATSPLRVDAPPLSCGPTQRRGGACACKSRLSPVCASPLDLGLFGNASSARVKVNHPRRGSDPAPGRAAPAGKTLASGCGPRRVPSSKNRDAQLGVRRPGAQQAGARQRGGTLAPASVPLTRWGSRGWGALCSSALEPLQPGRGVARATGSAGWL